MMVTPALVVVVAVVADAPVVAAAAVVVTPPTPAHAAVTRMARAAALARRPELNLLLAVLKNSVFRKVEGTELV
jgi:hypothetical protein